MTVKFKSWQSLTFQENSFFPKKGQNRLKMTKFKSFLSFSKNVVTAFPGFGAKLKFILLACKNPISGKSLVLEL